MIYIYICQHAFKIVISKGGTILRPHEDVQSIASSTCASARRSICSEASSACASARRSLCSIAFRRYASRHERYYTPPTPPKPPHAHAICSLAWSARASARRSICSEASSACASARRSLCSIAFRRYASRHERYYTPPTPPNHHTRTPSTRRCHQKHRTSCRGG